MKRRGRETREEGTAKGTGNPNIRYKDNQSGRYKMTVKKLSAILFAAAAAAGSTTMAAEAGKADYPITPISFTKVHYTAGPLADRQAVNLKETIPYAEQQNRSRLKNFDLAAETMARRAAGEEHFQHRPPTEYPFDDTDIYKYIEGASYALMLKDDSALRDQLKEIVKHVKAAQEPDGYLYTFRTMHPDSPGHSWIDQKRWVKDPDLSHELYNLGHFYECATAYLEATGDRTLYDMALKSAELVWKDLGQDNSPVIAPGHQVIEMGLGKLYRQSGDERWIKLAAKFLENKAKGRGGSDYNQSHKPVLQQDEAVGHAVRANYMYSGMADVATLTGDKRYADAIDKIWDNVAGKKLHLTGGCGARGSGEAYGANYELPNKCYNETCAAVAFIFWTHRMFLMHGDSYYMDVLERTMYNGALSGVGLDGKHFFYPNVLEYNGDGSNRNPRQAWFGCACCPPNIMRTIASLGGYAYAVKDSKLYTLVYADSEMSHDDVKITQKTEYPWDGKVTLNVNVPENGKKFQLALRIPGWVNGKPLPSDLYTYVNDTPAKWSVSVNGQKADYTMEQGFAVLDRTWKNGDKVELNLPMEVRRVKANDKAGNLKGQVGFERGPIVFAFEAIDQKTDLQFRRWYASPEAKAEAVFRKDLLGGVETVVITEGENQFTGIPYGWWANRGSHSMRVWLADAPQAELNMKNKSPQARVNVSYARGGMNPAAINDNDFPENAFATDVSNFDFWSHLGGNEWVTLTWKEPVEVSLCKFYWFDDSRRGGGCGVPAAWELKYQNANGEWVPVQSSRQSSDSIEFNKISTKALRLDIRQKNGLASGLYEWVVE